MKRKQNVLSIADSPKYKKLPVDKETCLWGMSQIEADNADFIVCRITNNVFGFMADDRLICAKNFNESEIKSNSMVIIKSGDDFGVSSNVSDTSSIYAIVKRFQREAA